MPEFGEPLSEREMAILELVATGVTNREVAHRLDISVNTVKVHLRNVYAKLGAESRTEATMIAVREGWVGIGSAGEREAVGPGDEAGVPVAALPQPLPRFKRGALIAALLLVVGGTVLTRPREAPQASGDPALLDLPSTEGQFVPTPASDSSWHERAQMPTRRAYLALAAVGDRILAVGGRTPEGITGAVEVYDPLEDLWTRGSDKPAPLRYAPAAAIGMEVYVCGGCDDGGSPVRTVEVYDVTADAWRAAAPLPEARCAAALVAWEGRLYLFGGWDGAEYSAAAYVYDPQADAWAGIAPMDVRRGSCAAAVLGDALYVVGGHDGERELTTCAAYRPGTGTWDRCAPLAVGRGGLGLAALGGRLYAIGGGGWTSYLGFSERYDPAADAWQPFETPLVKEWRSPGVAALDNTIYAIGGWSADYLSLNQAYEPLPFRIFIPVSRQE